MQTVLPAFRKFAAEGQLIGELLAGYSDIEVSLMNCVQVMRGDFDTTLKAMYRARGETQRLDIADALGRQGYRALELGTPFEMAIGNARYCLKIRNQFAHCVWWDDLSGQLAFANLEEVAIQNDRLDDLGSLTTYYVDVPLLQSQMDYFSYTISMIDHTNFEGRVNAGKLKSNPLSKPRSQLRPGLHLPQSAVHP